MDLSFYGAAKSVTGSKHLLTLNNQERILLDCGMFQGSGDKVHELNEDFGFEPESINYLLLSHAHIDHSGLIPRLVKMGFKGKIFCTPPTLELCRLILMDSAGIQQAERGHEDVGVYGTALYTKKDVEACLQQFETVPYNQPYRLNKEVEFLFTDVGHILGSAAVHLTITENEEKSLRLSFTGDIGRHENRILRAPQPFPQADILICESTYGNSFHASIENTEERLLDIVLDTCMKKKGRLLIPAFSIGRTQELVYSLNVLAEEGKIPKHIRVYVDSPLSVYATDIMREHEECFNKQMQEYLKFDDDPFGFPQLHFITETDDSKLLVASDDPCVIISASGMMQGGRIQHHLFNNLSHEKNTLLITGYCEPSTLGGRLLAGAKSVNIFGEKVEVKAEILRMNEYSAHADYEDIVRFLHCQDKDQIQKIFLVHGEEESMKKLKRDMEELGYKNIQIPDFRLSYELRHIKKQQPEKKAN
ncbi:MBL fold metallo-hydrolase RNA specificity domain-containing protein [Nafulsella turpanensis]|uniref:MBL fold metallo-hydrolase RNA specificity domain-containing protein n=1 Tax=Nafulsella turpanensis TaxID=1265690 RepID=UPI000348DD44|nr:MBL fold metallo-hydrolase [Nafulsella turpanensis]